MAERDLLERLLKVAEHTLHELREIKRELQPKPPIKSFIIKQQGERMALLPIAPGFSPVFTATPTPAGTAPGPGLVPTWTSSDTVNAPVTADPTGLIGTVALPATAVVGGSFTLTVSLTNADGTVATGSATFTIVAPPSPDVTGFTIQQSV